MTATCQNHMCWNRLVTVNGSDDKPTDRSVGHRSISSDWTVPLLVYCYLPVIYSIDSVCSAWLGYFTQHPLGMLPH